MKSEIILPLPELKTALPGLTKLVDRRTTLPVLSCVKISRQKNGLVTLQATDLDAHATYTLEQKQPGEVVEVLVSLEHLNKAFKCNAASKQAVALVSDGDVSKLCYSIGGNPVEQPFKPLPLKEWPACPEITVNCSPLQPGFGEALKQAMECCSGDASSYMLRGACLDASDEKAHYVVATNRRFLYSANSFTFPLKGIVIIPDSKFIHSSGLLDGEPCFLGVQPVPVKRAGGARSAKAASPEPVKYICLRNEHWQFVTREIEGNYPNWKEVVPVINRDWTRIQLQPSAIEQMLNVIPDLPGADQDLKPIKLRIGDRCLWVEGKNKDDADWTKIAISDVVITGRAKEIAIHRDLLLPALKFGLNELAIENELTPMVCRKEGKQVVIMPINLKAPQIAKPSAPQPTPATEPEQVERKTDMARTSTKPAETPQPAQTPASLIEQVEQIKETLKTVVRDLNGLVDAVKQAEKDKRASEKEVETARTVLKKLQQVSI